MYKISPLLLLLGMEGLMDKTGMDIPKVVLSEEIVGRHSAKRIEIAKSKRRRKAERMRQHIKS